MSQRHHSPSTYGSSLSGAASADSSLSVKPTCLFPERVPSFMQFSPLFKVVCTQFETVRPSIRYTMYVCRTSRFLTYVYAGR
jgi:hypothetical protein